MRRAIVQILINMLALFLAAKFVPGIEYDGRWDTLLFAGAVLGLVNFFIKPLVSFLAFPLLVLSLGLFSIVINAGMLWLTDYFVPGFRVDSFTAAILGVLIISAVNIFLSSFKEKAKEEGEK